jgi:hypothetical protein
VAAADYALCLRCAGSCFASLGGLGAFRKEMLSIMPSVRDGSSPSLMAVWALSGLKKENCDYNVFGVLSVVMIERALL